MSLNLSGVAFVTGAGGSLGRATALGLARHGVSKIAGLDINADALEGTAEAVSSLNLGVEFLAQVADLTSEEAVQTAIREVIDKFGAIHYAVNNAGIGQPLVPTSEADSKDFDRVMNVNFRGVWLCEKYELQAMLKQDERSISSITPTSARNERGSIVNVSSVLGLLVMHNLAIYNSSKHAILGLTKSDALDYAKKGIRVNSVCPGFIDTPLLTQDTRKALASTIDRIPQGRLAMPEEVADSICFLLSGMATHLTGVCLPVDGGFSAI